MKMLVSTLFATFLSVACCSKSAIKQSEKVTETKSAKTEVVENISEKSPVQQGRRGAMRTVEGNKIIRTVDASQLPFTIGEQFTDENQQFVIVIKNVTKSTISAKINTIEKDRNLRINQIILPDGSSDGPFSKEMKYTKKKNGTYKIVIGKNLMAEGKLVGNVSVSVE